MILAARRAVVVGVASPLGAQIARGLAEREIAVIGTSRRRIEATGWRESRTFDLSALEGASSLFADADLAVLTPGLTLSRRALPALVEAGVRRTVFFSSNNVAVTPHDPIYAAILDAERAVAASGLDYAILRPTLIYGRAERTDGFARLLRLMDRWPLAPLAGSGAALQQPIHVEDLARITVETALEGGFENATLALGGPDVASMREVYQRMTAALGVRRIVAPIPTAALRSLADIARRFGRQLPVTQAQLERADLDKPVRPIPDAPPPPPARIALPEGLDRQIRLMRRKGLLRIR